MTTPQDHPPVPPHQPPFAAPQQPPQFAGAPAREPQQADAPHGSAHPVVNPAIAEAVPKLRRYAIWTAIGALIGAAVICVIWVLIGSSSDIAPRAFLTVLLLAGFAGISILETNLAPRREPWFSLVSMIVWVATLLIGAMMIWMPAPPYDDFGGYVVARFFKFALIVLILQLGVLHLRLYSKAWRRHRTVFANVVAITTIVLVALLAVALVFPLVANEWIHFRDLYWRLTVAIAILAAVGTALLPLTNALFAPRQPRVRAAAPESYAHGVASAAPVAIAPQGWPVYAGTQMPLPMLPDGSPDWQAYYTGHPTPGAIAVGLPAHPAPSQHPAGPQQPAPQHPAPPASGLPQPPPVPPAPAPQQPPAAPQSPAPPAPPVPPAS